MPLKSSGYHDNSMVVGLELREGHVATNGNIAYEPTASRLGETRELVNAILGYKI